ncbi:hypothetical protein CASFOL_015164 [Castilleja foliolosa]|uniref:Uncharacterized protein n=1 Tax=Castilleja foliolosa TaxID=1961234 RepID=A0ABD3DGX5_9LAMI
MLQRQIMFKQLQELQRKQQLQELGNNNRNQNYANQLPSLKQDSGGQYLPTANETPAQGSSQMFMVNNMQMLQHGGSDGLVFSQNHNLAPQFDMSAYLTHSPNSSDNLNQYSHFQGSFVSNQENNLFGQVPVGGLNSMTLPNYPQQGFPMPKSEDSGKGNENAASLDPLEHKILYNTDGSSWESALSKISNSSSSGFDNSSVENSSMLSGSWSALMQSAVAETSSSDAGIQEEWSGLSFQNPEPLKDAEKLQNDWVDRDLQNDSSPSSKPDNLFQNVNSFNNFQQPAQYIKQKEEYHPESPHATMQISPRNTCQLVDNISQPCNSFSGHEFGSTYGIQGSTSGHMLSVQKKYNQVNQLKTHGYSLESDSMDHVGGSNGESVVAPSESMFELLNKDDTSNDQTPAMQLSSQVPIHRELPNTLDFGFRMVPTDHPQTPQSYSFSPSLSGNSNATSLQFPAYSAPPQDHSELKIPDSSGSEFPLQENAPESQPSLTPDMLQHGGFSMGPAILWPENQNSFQHEYQQPVKNETPSFPARDIGAFPQSLNQNYSPLPQALSSSDVGTYNVNNQHSIANARKLLLRELQQQSVFKASSMPYNQNTQQKDTFSQNYTSNLAYQSHISSQMGPSRFKHYEALKSGHILPMYDTRAPNNAAQPFAEMTLANLQENKLVMQVNLDSVVCPSTALTSVASKQLNPACALASDVTDHNLAISKPKKRKLAALDMVPWHEEVNHQQPRLQDISTAEYLWAKALNRKPEEALNDAEIVEGLPSVTRAKRRLICSTQLMQQIFLPAPVFILCSDAIPNCDCVAYFAARLTLGDAWSLTGQLMSDTNNMSLDELKTSKRTKACKFVKVVEALINRVNEVEAELQRLDKSISYVDMKVEALELEKFSTINRFAKFHIRAHPINTDPASSSGKAALLKTNLQKYVVPVPMPETIPEGQECLSL